MLLWGKRKRKRSEALRRAATYFLWQAAMSIAGGAATRSMRDRFKIMLRQYGSDALDRAEESARRDLADAPDSLEMAVQYAEVAVARQQWDEAARRWTALLDRHASRINGEIYERIHLAYTRDGNIADAEAIAALAGETNRAYQDWCRERDTLTADDVQRLQRAVQGWEHAPLISVLLRCCDPPIDELAETIDAIAAQIYPRWELCIVDDASIDPRVRERIQAHAAVDARIRVIQHQSRLGSARSFNAALDAARGEFCWLLNQRDLPARHALLFLAGEVARNGGVDWLYSDFDHVDAAGRRLSPVLRSGPDPELCRALPYMGARAAYRTTMLRAAGGLRDGFDGAHDHDLALRMLERMPVDRIRHVRSILYHRRASSEPEMRHLRERHGVRGAAERAVQDHLDRAGISATASELHASPGCRIRYALPEPAPLVSIVIPTRDRLDLLCPCIDSIRDRTSYPRFELIVIDNGSVEPASEKYFNYLQVHAGVRVLHEPQPFNWSRLNNLGAMAANGSVLCFLNNDVEIVNEGWLTELVSQAMRPEVGVVGAALWYPDGRLQHGGVVFTPSTGHPTHAMLGVKRAGRPLRARVAQSYLAVTGACMAMRKEVFTAAGGFDEVALPIGYSDVDICRRIDDKLGLRCVWTPFAELLHRESASRGRLSARADYARNERDRRTLLNRWYEQLVDDPCCHPTVTSRQHPGADHPGVRAILNRHAHRRPLRLAFIHIPKTAGVALRTKFVDTFPRPSTLAVSSRTLLRCYEGDAAAMEALRRRLPDALILFSHFSHGFGGLVGWDCAYAAVLRTPVDRVLSHYRHMFKAPFAPFLNTPLAAPPLHVLLRKGALPGNLMLRKILGEAPEEATWEEINAHGAIGAAFAGFHAPAAAWRGQYEKLLAAPDIEPDLDMSKVDRAMAIVERDFAFVGRVEALQAHMDALFESMGIVDAGGLARVNVVASQAAAEVGAGDLGAAREFNALDQALYDRIARLPGGLFLNPGRLYAPAP